MSLNDLLKRKLAGKKMAEIILAVVPSSTCFEQQSVESQAVIIKQDFCHVFIYSRCVTFQEGLSRGKKRKKRDPSLRIFKILHYAPSTRIRTF